MSPAKSTQNTGTEADADTGADTTPARLAAIETSLAQGRQRMDRMQTELTVNTEITAEVRDLLNSFKGGFRVLGWLGVGGGNLALPA